MKNWIKENKLPFIAILLTLIIVLGIGINAGLGYLSAENQSFITEISQGSIDDYVLHNGNAPLPSLTIAQAILESAWGRSDMGANNLFGIKVGSSWKGEYVTKNTKEYYNGQWVTIQAKFRKYPTTAGSLKDHNDLIRNASRYKPVLAAKDYKEAAHQIYVCGYATDVGYKNKIISIIETNGLDKYDIQAKKILTDNIKKVEEERIAKLMKFKYFKDVPDGQNQWFTDAINRLYEQGIVKGDTNTGELLARPLDNMTRAEVFVLIDRILNPEDK